MEQTPFNLPAYDPWLDRWSALLKKPGSLALDVGCGPGFDTQVLSSWGFNVTAIDISPEAIAQSRQRNPSIKHLQADARTLEPFVDQSFDLVVASLSLHYFDEAGSHQAFGAVNRVLRRDGLFAFRVNAWDDYEFGASKDSSSWESVLHRGQRKQFFSEKRIGEVLAGRFEILSMEKLITYRYQKKKSLFECITRK